MTGPTFAVGAWRIGTRLFVAQVIVVLAIVISTGLVASLVGPPLFHAHLIESGHSPQSPELAHVEEAFAYASTISLSAGLVVALAAAIAITWYLARRFSRPLESLTTAATRLSDGDYAARASAVEGGPEFALLGESFNLMADRLEHTEATRRRLLADLAHEMRTPIATLNAHLEGISDGVLSWDDATRDIVEHQADRLTRLVRDLDEVSRAEEGRITLDVDSYPVVDLVEASVAQVRRAFEAKGVELTASVGPELVLADPQRVAQILGNVLNNALRHTPAGGRVDVGSTSTADAVSVTFRDTGEGMTAEQLQHVFERFYRGDTSRATDRGGSGIGLTIARALAEAHGGRLHAESAGPGLGSTFTLTLPRAEPGRSASGLATPPS